MNRTHLPPRMAMPEFSQLFRESFPDLGSANRFLDELLSASTMAPRLDTIALNDAIEAKHGAIPDGESLAEAVTRLYGEGATAFVRRVL